MVRTWTSEVEGQGIVQTTNRKGSENYSGKKILCPQGRAGSIPASATKGPF